MPNINTILNQNTNYNLNDFRIPDPTDSVADLIVATDGNGNYKLADDLGGVKSLNGATGDLTYTRLNQYGILDAYINNNQVVLGDKVLNCATQEQIASLAPKATTLGGYGIADAKIENGKVKLGSNEIEPLVPNSAAKDVEFQDVTARLVDAGISYITTAPTAPNPNGLKFVVLDAQPAQKYDGWIYFITE